MRSARPSIAGLMGVVGLIAAGFAALGSPSRLWSFGLLGLEYLILLSAVLGIVLLREQERASCVGCALFGWGYILLSFNAVLSPASSRPYAYPYASTYAMSQEGLPILTPSELTRELLDLIDVRTRNLSKSVGDRIEVLWGSSYYPSKITQVNGEVFKIRYDSDPAGTYDEWITISRARGILNPYYYCIGHSLAALLSGVIGAVIARRFWSGTRRRYPIVGLSANPET